MVDHGCERPIESSVVHYPVSRINRFYGACREYFHTFFIRHPPKLDNKKHSLPNLEVENPYLSFLCSYLS